MFMLPLACSLLGAAALRRIVRWGAADPCIIGGVLFPVPLLFGALWQFHSRPALLAATTFLPPCVHCTPAALTNQEAAS